MEFGVERLIVVKKEMKTEEKRRGNAEGEFSIFKVHFHLILREFYGRREVDDSKQTFIIILFSAIGVRRARGKPDK